jgi:hypothetical protein
VQAARASFASAYFDEQRREQAEARVPFLLVPFLWARKEKTLAEGRKATSQSSKEIPIKISYEGAVLVLYWNKAIHVPCLDSPLQGALASASANRFAGPEHAQRNSCYTLRQNDGLLK